MNVLNWFGVLSIDVIVIATAVSCIQSHFGVLEVYTRTIDILMAVYTRCPAKRFFHVAVYLEDKQPCRRRALNIQTKGKSRFRPARDHEGPEGL
jgi:hypothetical protein